MDNILYRRDWLGLLSNVIRESRVKIHQAENSTIYPTIFCGKFITDYASSLHRC